MPYEHELQAALEAARLAGRRIMEIFATFTAIPDAQVNITTQADFDSQELILLALSARYPADGFVAEEKTPTLAILPREGQRRWVIDPIDGTRGFAQKSDEFSVMIGLVEGPEVVVGVVLEPAKARITYATRGGGCWRLDGQATALPCRVTSNAQLDAIVLTQSHSRPGVVTRQVTALAPKVVRETHSAGVKLALVARGEVDLYVNHYPNFHDWDICAGHVLVEEAGGRVTTLRGQAIRYGSSNADQRLGLMASNGVLHKDVLRTLGEA
jgi:3'(2'), 5'-bisphosphate nucleotidase